MEALQRLLDSTNAPVLSAFILGLMVAISPCPLATNITAIGYIGRDLDDRKMIFLNGLYYTAGRAVSYSLLGLLLYIGASKFHVARIFSVFGEKLLGPILLIIGILMLDIISLRLPGMGKLTERFSGAFEGRKPLGAFLLGVIFALAFCPYSGVLFFGMLIPLAIASAKGLYLPVVFAFATGLPVIIIAYLIAYSLSGIAVFYKKIRIFQTLFNRAVALIFIGAGIYFMVIYFVIG
jgi:cytochrome c biogenesis protein CcdA